MDGPFDASSLSANEYAEDVLQRLGIIDDEGRQIDTLPLTEDEARSRLTCS